MAMPEPRTRWTLAEVNALPSDGNRYELVDGELLVSPAPRLWHQVVLKRLYDMINPYVSEMGDHLCLPLAVDVSFEEEQVMQPDLLVMPLLPGGRVPERFTDVGRLLLAVEVLSPSTEWYDRVVKRTAFQPHVPEYWVVDPDRERVERWRPGDAEPEVCTGTMSWHPMERLAPLTLDLTALFAGR